MTFNPAPAVNISSSQDTTCPGGTVTLTATGANSYLWSTGDTDAVIIVNPAVITQYTVTGISNGCPGSPDTITIAIDSSLLPTVSISPDTGATICSGGSFILTASGGSSYLWSTGDVAASIMVFPTSTTTYSVTTTDFNNCTSVSDSVQITVSGGVLAGFYTSPESGEIPLTVAFTDTSTGAYSWDWDFGDGDNATSQDPVHIYTDEGQYEIILTATDQYGCFDTASFIISVTEDTAIFIPTLFSPNCDLMNDILYVRGSGIDWLLLIIYDRWGEKVFEGTMNEVWAEEGTYPENTGWDGTFKGKQMNPAVFVYVLNGAYKDGKEIDKKGNITLVR